MNTRPLACFQLSSRIYVRFLQHKNRCKNKRRFSVSQVRCHASKDFLNFKICNAFRNRAGEHKSNFCCDLCIAGMRERRTVVEWVGRSHCNKRRLGVKVKTITLDVLPCRVSFFPNDLIPNVQRYILSTELPLPQTKSAQRIMLSN